MFVSKTCSYLRRLQTVWLTIFSHGTIYLSSLGISQLHTSLIWTAVPICGCIVPPIVGVLSDRSQFTWGRRRPFMLIGTITIILAISALAWIEPITALICSLHGNPKMATDIMQYWVIIWVTILNIGIQCLQSATRALIVDTCPSEQQSLASAWAGRFTGFGNILGYLIGSIPLPWMASDNEAWRFRCMSLFAVIVLAIAVSTTSYFIHEDECSARVTGSVLTGTFRGIMEGVRAMPPKARRVCKVQFFSAMGWFGFLFYSTSYVRVLYLEDFARHTVSATSKPQDRSMRSATSASFLFSIVALCMNIVLPLLHKSKESSRPPRKGDLISLCENIFQIQVLWSLGHMLYAILAASTFFITSGLGGTAFVILTGVSWGITQWAPFALLGEEIANQQNDPELLIESGTKEKAPSRSGAMLGVHSVAVSVPQIMAAFACSCIFWITSTIGAGEGVRWILRCSGVAGAVAAWLACQT